MLYKHIQNKIFNSLKIKIIFPLYYSVYSLIREDKEKFKKKINI